MEGQTRVRQLRINAGLSVPQLAKKAGMANSALYHIEAGVRVRLQQRTIDRLAKALSVAPEELFVPFCAYPRPISRPAAKWIVIIICPKCGQKFRLEVFEGEADPVEGMAVCPFCAFGQFISLRRAS